MPHPSRMDALIVAAGRGRRVGGEVPKQYQSIGGKPLLCYAMEALSAHPSLAGVQVVIDPEHTALYDQACSVIPEGLRAKLLPPVLGGAERADSVRSGLAALVPRQPDYVLVHDAARPFLSAAMIDRILAALTMEEAVIPAIAVADTVRRFDGVHWHEVSREGLLRVQTPQAFPFQRLQAMVAGHAAPASPTDEAALWLAAGGRLRYVEGDERLRKVTHAADIAWANAKAAPATRTVVGMGFDVHALMPAGDAGVIRLGGIDLPHSHKLHGHSDADVVLHAVVDALFGTVCEGDIGSHFPPSDPRWRGANSAVFVEEACARVAAHGGVIEHLDITIIGEQPKIAPHRDAMRVAIAALLNLPLGCVSVKATTTEKLGFTGRDEGIACQAVATVTLPREAV